ncbi:MAG: hypothetical protein EHM57_03320 [Actinobacteria bacterium]|nr:MAG: hypothetical protein EHM57_03320 [Actinomycetota bacterium]
MLEFSGNRFTPCMHHADGSPMGGGEAFLKYLADARAAIDVFASTGTVVYLAGAPVRRENDGTVQGGAMNALYRWLGLLDAGDNVVYVDAGRALLRDGRYTDRLPCLPGEPCEGDDGTNPVRSPDGLHLCPAEMWSLKSPSPECPVWSSGAYRYGLALAAPVIAGLIEAA